MKKVWLIERSIACGTWSDRVEICRCDSAESAAAVVAALLSASVPPDMIVITPVIAGM